MSYLFIQKQFQIVKKYVLTQAFLDHYDETRKRAEWKLELRKSNRDTNPLEEDALHRLDSSLKKNTAFVRKIRQSFNADSAAGLTKDAKSLNLTKYMGEVTNAIVEVKLKTNDVKGMVELCSFLHQVQ